MPADRPTDTEIESLLRGRLPPAEADRLAAGLADDSRVSAVAEGLPDDTMMSDVRRTDTSVDDAAERLTERLVERLKPSAEATMTAALSTDGSVLVGEDEPAPAALEYFRIERVLGRGGMGTVYLADDTRLGRKVALKTLKADAARKPGAKERFLREARLAAALEHECLVPIYYVGESAGIPFLAMPLLKGQALDDYLAANGGRLPVDEAVRVGREVARGLAAAHAAGLTHRDIKPSNVWVDGPGGRVRVLDFGLARSATDDAHLTASGVIVGTPAYMAPEQARGRPVDGRADLFSLGVMLYQMLTGRRPFVGTDTVAVLSSLALDIPAAPREVNPEVPPYLSDLVMRLLEKKPNDRLPNADAVLAALTPPAPAVVVSAPWREAEQTEVIFADMAAPPPRAAKAKAAVKAGTGRKMPVAAMVALAVLLLGGAAAGVYQFVFATRDGTLVVEVAEDADVRFKNGKLEVYDEAGKKLYTLEPSEKNNALPPGKYRVRVVGADGVKLDTETFELERKGKAFVKVTAAGPTDVAKKPDPGRPDPVTRGVPGGSGLAVSTRMIAEAPNPGLDVTKPWTVEAYLTPLTADLTTYSSMCQVLGADHEFGLGVMGGKYVGYSHHGETTGGAVTVGERVHLACVQTDKERRVFVNGKLVASAPNILQDANPKRDALRFKVLSASELDSTVLVEGVRVSQAVRYTQEFTPPGRHAPDKDTLALYHCDEGQGDKLTDSSGNNLHGKIINAKWGNAPAVPPPLDPAWLKAVAALPPEKQLDAIMAELKKRNPEFVVPSEHNRHAVEGNAVVGLDLDGKLTDLTPVRALTGLRKLQVRHIVNNNAARFPLVDLSPLTGLSLTHLDVSAAEVTDLTPLKGMPLVSLNLFLCEKVCDLSPLAGLPLERLILRETPVADLTPIKGLKLKQLDLSATRVPDLKAVGGMPLESLEANRLITDLSPLQGMKLKLLHVEKRVVSDLSPLKGMPLEEFWGIGPKVTDLSPLEGMPLKAIDKYEVNLERDGKVLRSLKSLETINGKPAKEVLGGP